MRKAYVFTLDVLFSVIILSMALVIVSYEMNISQEFSVLLKTGEDFFTSMDKLWILKDLASQSQGEGEQTLSTYLDSLLPQFGSNITVKIYEYQQDDFILKKTFNASLGIYTTFSKEKVSLRRIFAHPDDGYYGIAYLDIWYE